MIHDGGAQAMYMKLKVHTKNTPTPLNLLGCISIQELFLALFSICYTNSSDTPNPTEWPQQCIIQWGFLATERWCNVWNASVWVAAVRSFTGNSNACAGVFNSFVWDARRSNNVVSREGKDNKARRWLFIVCCNHEWKYSELHLWLSFNQEGVHRVATRSKFLRMASVSTSSLRPYSFGSLTNLHKPIRPPVSALLPLTPPLPMPLPRLHHVCSLLTLISEPQVLDPRRHLFG